MTEERIEKQVNKKVYMKPEIEIIVFENENICSLSGVHGDTLGMFGENY
jgi:hypothetical protein